jgi:hypothetical protein
MHPCFVARTFGSRAWFLGQAALTVKRKVTMFPPPQALLRQAEETGSLGESTLVDWWWRLLMRRPFRTSFVHCLAAMIAMTSIVVAADVPSVQFEKSIAPLLMSKCLACHSGDEVKGGLDLISAEKLRTGGESGAGVVPGKPDESPIWQRVSADEMPPKHPLSEKEKATLKSWIEAGAVWTGGDLNPLKVSTEQRAGYDWWSLQPLSKVVCPTVRDVSRVREPIDSFVQARLNARGFEPAPPADPRVLIRRVTFDLLGLPPAPEEINEFLAEDRPDAYERLIDRLLASPHYGERWARHWLDIVRFGESNGFERDLPRPNAWPYRDWVLQALNRDMPYDEFVRWQLAGDIIAPNSVSAMQAVGFLVAGPHDTVVPVVDRMRATMRQDELEDTIGVVGQTFLGLTVNCARCHDHKFDPITAKEYYQIASALAGADHGEREFTPPETTRQLSAWQARIDLLTKQLQEQDSPIREKILAERSRTPGEVPSPNLPVPIAAWDFTRDAKDQIGPMHARLIGTAKLEREGLVVDGNSFAMTAPLAKDLAEKTLQVRVRLQSLQQSGGGAISLQTVDGETFDAIVYGELEPNRWMPGSTGFQRTASYGGTAEEQADKQFVTITQVHRDDGTIVCYRNGQPYGNPVRKDQAVRYGSGKAQVVFGLRHGTDAGGNRMLNGTIASARLYDRALSHEEVAASSDSTNSYITEAEIASKLSANQRVVRASQQNELTDLRVKHAQVSKAGPLKIYSAIATQPPAMKIHKRGSVSLLGEEVAAAGLVALQGVDPNFGLKPDAIESHRRLKLANWITDANNPLFARVLTNRLWHYHFGAGLIETPSDLGFNGGNPSHPELLEWLSSEFAAADGPRRFSIKRLHRLMVSSATYRQSSQLNPQASAVDAGNRLLWRMNPHRLEAESVRDAILCVAGQLNTELGGKGYADVNSYFFKGTQFYDPIDPPGFANNRRTLYRMWARGGRSPFLDTFDCPDPSTTTPRRSATVTPLQALSLLNHSFSLRMAEQFALRLKSDVGDSSADQIRRAYLLLFGREATADEVNFSQTFVKRRGLPAFCRAMWNSSEFLFVD